MTGGSLGLRTGSYGSLQQHLQNSVLLRIQTTPTPPNIGRMQAFEDALVRSKREGEVPILVMQGGHPKEGRDAFTGVSF